MLDFNFSEVTLPSAFALLTQIYFNAIFPAVSLAFVFSGSANKWRMMMFEELAVIFESIIFGATALIPFVLAENDTWTWFEYFITFVMATIPIWLLSVTFGNKQPMMFRVFFDFHLYVCLNQVFSWYTTCGAEYKNGFLGTFHFYFNNIAMIRMIYLSIRVVINEIRITNANKITIEKQKQQRTMWNLGPRADINNNYVK